jgi:xanthine/uracil permease
LALILCAFSPALISIFSAIPNTVIGVILLYLMGTQLAASFVMMSSTESGNTFDNALIIGLPIMAAMLFGAIPMDVIPALVRPLVGNGFAMGVIIVILLEHIILRKR